MQTGSREPADRTRARAASGAQILTVRPWSPADEDPAFPKVILGTVVIEHVLTRLDRPGALVKLADGRYAFTGTVLGVGPARPLQEAARHQLDHVGADAERTWWREVIGTLAR